MLGGKIINRNWKSKENDRKGRRIEAKNETSTIRRKRWGGMNFLASAGI